MLYEGPTGEGFSWDERVESYPEGLQVVIDGVEFSTAGKAVLEVKPGAPPRRWVAVRQRTSSGALLSRTRLIDERGVKGLRQQVEKAQHLQQEH